MAVGARATVEAAAGECGAWTASSGTLGILTYFAMETGFF